MSTLSKVLLVMVCLASLGFLWAGSRALKTWTSYRQVHDRYVKAVDGVERSIVQIRDGNDTEPSIDELKTEQAIVYYDRGRVWTACSPRGFDPQTGVVQVRTGFPDPPEIQANTVVHVFEASDDPVLGNRRYVGEFTVTAAAPPDPGGQAPNITLEWLHKFTIADVQRQVQRIQGVNTAGLQAAVGAGNLNQLNTEISNLLTGLQNNPQLTPDQKITAHFELGQLAFMVREIQRVANSTAPWSLYEVMPGDSFERFAEIPPDEVQGSFPAPDTSMMTVEEQQLLTTIRDLSHRQYVNHGQPAGDEDPKEEVLVRVRFKKNFGDPGVDQQALAQLHILDYSREADPVRRADATRLVAEGQEAWVSAEVVDELKNLGLVDELERRYQRPRRDYTQLFNEFYRASPVLDDKFRAVVADRDRTNAAAALAEAHNVKLQQLEQELTAERDRLVQEEMVVAAHVAELEQQTAAIQQHIDALERQNQEWTAKLAEEQIKLQRRIEAAASAQASSP